MLRFDNIPPQSPDEVNFTGEAIKEFDAMLSFSTAPSFDYGRVLAGIVVANSGENPLNPNFELAESVVVHLDEQVGDHPVTRAMAMYVQHSREKLGARNV